MSHAHRPHDARGQFARLIAALGRRIGQPLLPDEGSVALADARDALQLMVELSTEEDCIHALRPFLGIPDDDAKAGELALEMLRLNADRDALGDAPVCAIAQHRQFCLVVRLELDIGPAAFVLAVEELAELGDALHATLSGSPQPLPRPADMQLHRA